MAGNRLTGSEKRALFLWVLAGIVGVVFAQRYFFRAFPEASVTFRVTREEALIRARSFVSGLGENVSGYQSAIVFNLDDNAKTYLERELGLQEANRMMASELNIWYWDVRFFRPQKEEEFRVQVNPAGEIVGYAHTIEEARAGATLDRAAAQTQAQKFLTDRLGVDLGKWDFLAEEASSKKLPNRLHWEFTWEKHGFRAKDAPYRLGVVVDGDRVNGSTQILKVPEAWERGYKRLRSSNETLTLVFFVPYLLLLGAAVGLAIVLTRKGQTAWGGAIKIGIVVAGLMFLQGLNDWPLWAASYDTKDSYGSFLASRIAISLLLALVTGAFTVAAIVPSAEPLYRATQPGRLRLGKAFTLRGIRSKEFFSSAVVGLSMAAAHIGYLVVFYIVAGHFGAWAPQELNYENSVSTAFPWITGAAIGVTAATSEEFLFRLFAIPFLERMTRSRWIAVILPAFMWSFLHSNYPQEPAYVRGIEIGVIGIVAGIVMLRWGILATLIWHYTVDASLVGLLLIRSSSVYLQISGVVVGGAALIPLAYAGISYLVRGGFESDEDLLNRAEPVSDISFETGATERAEAVGVRRYDALTSGKMIFLAACLVLGGLAAWKLRTPALGDFLKLSMDARTAKSRADGILRQRGSNPDSYHHATGFVNITDPYVNEFLRERIGIERLNAVYSKQVPGAIWQVRYFRDGQTEEYSIKLDPDGSLLAVNHRLAEDAPGASLSKEEAIARAEKFVREEKKIDLSQWSLLEVESDKRSHRIDHELTWQQNAPIDSGSASPTEPTSHAYVRIKVAVLGDEVADYRGSYYPKSESREELEQKEGGTLWTFIKIPDEWRRKQEETPFSRTILSLLIPVLLFGGFGITALILFLKNLRSEAARSIPWRSVATYAVLGLACFALTTAFGSGIPRLLGRYDTAVPLKAMYAGLVIGLVIGAAFWTGAIALLFGMAWYYARQAFGEERLPIEGKLPGTYYRDALWIGIAGTATLMGVHRVVQAMFAHWPTVQRSFDASFGQGFDAILPVGSILGGTVLRGLQYMGLVALTAAFIAAVLKPLWLRFSLFALGALFLVGNDWGSSEDYAKHFLMHAIVLGVVVAGVLWAMRFNILGGFLVVAFMSLLEAGTELLSQPDNFYRANGYAVVLALVLLLAWPLLAWRMRAARESSQTGARAV